MYTPQRVASLLIIYAAFVVGTCAICHFLLKSTASNLASAQYATAVKAQNSYSRVEGWLRRQAIANLKKSTVTTAARASSNPVPDAKRAEPGHDVVRAVAMAAAIDSAEQNRTGVVEADQGQIRNAHKRFRAPSCRELSCDQVAQLEAATADMTSLSKPQVKPEAKVASLKVIAQTSKNGVRGAARTPGMKIAGKASPKLQNSGAKSKASASAKAVAQARFKSQKKIALRRLIETPAEISYRSFVGTFVPAT